MSNPLRSHGLQHTSLPCPSLSSGVCSKSCPLSRWCHPTISSSVTPFSSCPQSFPASGSFPMNQLFPSGGQSTGASASTSVLPINIQGWFPLGWTGWISLPFKGLSRVFSSTTVWKHHFLGSQPSLWSNFHICTWLQIWLWGWKIIKEMDKPDHLTCHLKSLYSDQEGIVITGHRTMDWFKTRKGLHQSCILSYCLFNLYAEYIMQNAGLDEAQAGIKISRRNISNLRYVAL